MEITNEGPYLRGLQDTEHGRGKVVFDCGDGRIYFMSYYEAGSKAPDIAKGGWFHSLLINHEPSPLSKPRRLTADNGYVNAMFLLSPKNLSDIYDASSVGHAMQLAPDAPTFVGYWVDIDQI